MTLTVERVHLVQIIVVEALVWKVSTRVAEGQEDH